MFFLTNSIAKKFIYIKTVLILKKEKEKKTKKIRGAINVSLRILYCQSMPRCSGGRAATESCKSAKIESTECESLKGKS